MNERAPVQAEHDGVQRLDLLLIGFLGRARQERAMVRVTPARPLPAADPLLAFLNGL